MCGYQFILVLLSLYIPSSRGEKVWKCSGPQSKYSYLDCERDYSYTDGCYYVEHFSQFRPCAWICNDIEFNSIDEERCRAFCGAYLTHNCEVREPTSPTTTRRRSTTVTTENSTLQFTTVHSSPTVSSPQLSKIVLLVPLIVLCVICVVILAVVLLLRRKRRHGERRKRRHRKRREKKPLQTQAPVDCYQLVITIPVPVTADDDKLIYDNELNRKLEEKEMGEQKLLVE